MSDSLIHILLVEDNPGDARLLEEALRESKPLKQIAYAKDGQEALDYLADQAARRPDLIFLDLNLPRLSGKEFLEKVKKDDALKSIPIIVLTTSRATRDIKDCYDLGVNCFISKPLTLDEFMEMMSRVNDYWFGLARLPSAT